MPSYKWEGKTLRGEKRKGELEAPDEGSVRAQLRQQNVIPTKVVAKGKEVSFRFARQKVKQKDVAVFTRQLATMIDAGLPLVQSLDILSMQSDSKVFRETIKNIKESVEGGSTFAGALAKHPKTFDELYTNLVVAGEEGSTGWPFTSRKPRP
jgi:type IV pilus assembly protein PilC